MTLSHLRNSAFALLLAGLTLQAFSLHAEDAPKIQPQPPAPYDENAKAREALSNPPQAGRTEPSATNAATADQTKGGNPQQPEGPALVNGALNVNGAPKDSQTVPAKYSERNDRLDHTPIMALPILSEEQATRIRSTVLAANAPIQSTQAKMADSLPYDIKMNDLPAKNDPMLNGLKFVQTENSILLIKPSSRVVVAEITK